MDGGRLVTDKQVRRLFVLVKTEGSQETAAAKAGMDAKTARKYRRMGHLPSELPVGSRWRGQPDRFAKVWAEVLQEVSSIERLLNPPARHSGDLSRMERNCGGQ